MQYDNRGRGALWDNKSSAESAPVLKGNFVAHRDIKEGETVEIAAWPGRRYTEGGKHPRLDLKVSDERQREAKVAKAEPEPFEDDSSLPF